MKASKIPARRYECDDIAVSMQGETYYPHRGEWVEIRGGTSWDFQRTAAEYTALLGTALHDMAPAERATFSRCMQEIAEFVASRIVAWNWTGDDGKSYPNPPNAKVLGAISDDEMLWLVTTIREGRTPADAESAEKNA